MAYRKRKTTRRRAATRRGTYRSVRRGSRGGRRRTVRRATKRVSRGRRKKSAAPRRIVLVVRHEPVTPTLATPQAKAKPTRSRFTG